MNFVRNNWDKIAKEEFESYLDSIKETDEKKLNWTKRIYNTNMTVLGIKVPIIKKLVKEIIKDTSENKLIILTFLLQELVEKELIETVIVNELVDYLRQRHIMRILQNFILLVFYT